MKRKAALARSPSRRALAVLGAALCLAACTGCLVLSEIARTQTVRFTAASGEVALRYRIIEVETARGAEVGPSTGFAPAYGDRYTETTLREGQSRSFNVIPGYRFELYARNTGSGAAQLVIDIGGEEFRAINLAPGTYETYVGWTNPR